MVDKVVRVSFLESLAGVQGALHVPVDKLERCIEVFNVNQKRESSIRTVLHVHEIGGRVKKGTKQEYINKSTNSNKYEDFTG